MEKLRKTPSLYRKHLKCYSEDFLFAPGEDIMIYVDFPLRGAIADEEQIWKAAAEYTHSHDFFELLYVYRGTCCNLFNGKKSVLRSGSALIFDTRCNHGLYVTEGSVAVNIIMRKSSFNSNIQSFLQNNNVFLNFFLNSIYSDSGEPCCLRFDIEKGSMAERYIFHIIKEYYEKKPFYQNQLKLLFLSLILEFSRLYQNEPISEKKSSEFVAAKIISYIEENYSTVTLSSLCRRFGLSPSTAAGIIAQHTGCGFLEYVLNFRMENAASMLMATDLDIDSVAEAVGYVQRASFEKRFKKHFGQTPAQYRKNCKK